MNILLAKRHTAIPVALLCFSFYGCSVDPMKNGENATTVVPVPFPSSNGTVSSELSPGGEEFGGSFGGSSSLEEPICKDKPQPPPPPWIKLGKGSLCEEDETIFSSVESVPVLAKSVEQPTNTGTTVIFLDNSSSIKGLRDIYRHDLEVVMDSVGSDPFYLVAIGDSHKPPSQLQSQLLSSDLPKTERWDAIRQIFQFQDQYTHLHDSLKRFESDSAFKAAKQILIVSDMEPDYQIAAGSWVFDINDIYSVGNTQDLLRKWVEQGKQVYIVLHGWEERPQRDGQKILKDDTFEDLLKVQVQKAQGGRLVREPTENKKLVALSLIELKAKYPESVHLYPMPREINGYRNEEQFRQALCGFLPLSTSDKPKVCGGAVDKMPEGTGGFTIAIDIAPSLPLSDYFQVLKGQITDSEFIGPLRHFQVVHLDKGIRQDSRRPNTIFYFKVREGKKGPPYHKPRLYTYAKDRNGQWLNCSSQEPSKRQSSPDQATRWLASTINDKLTKIVGQYYPPDTVPKTIVLLNENDHPLVGEYKFSVYYKFKGLPGEYETQKRHVDQEGIINIPIYRELSQAKLYLKNKCERYYMGDLSVDLIKSPESIKFRIPRERKKAVTLTFEGAKSQTTEIEIFHQGGGQKISVHKGVYGSHRTPSPIYLLPGDYYWEAQPVGANKILGTSAKLTVLSPETDGSQNLLIDLVSDPLTVSQQRGSKISSILTSDGELTGNGEELIDGSAYFFKALLEYTSSEMSGYSGGKPSCSSKQAQSARLCRVIKLWEAVKIHIDKQSTDSQRLLKRSLLMIGATINRETQALNEQDLESLKIMFDMFIYGNSVMIEGSASHARNARQHYRKWVKKLLSRQYISSQLAKILKNGW
jgi:hypothetical protein